MYCKHCGGQIAHENAHVCLACGGLISESQPQFIYVQPPQKPKFYTASFVLGILSLCLGPWGPILGIIGLPLACISKRKSAIIMNIIGIVVWIAIYTSLIITSQHVFRDFDHDAHIQQMIDDLQETLDARQEVVDVPPYPYVTND